MANQGMDVGLVYGKARYRKLSISAGDENITALRATLGRKQVAVRYPEELVVATEISPGTKITIAADIKEKEVDASNKMYHDGNVPKQGNYYFSNQSTYTFDEWKDVRNGITLKTAVADGSSEYSFKMPMVDMIIEGKSKTSVAEVDKVYARELKVINGASGSSSGKWPISSVSIKQGSSTKASGVTDASAYFWESPTDVLTIQATLPGTETGDTLQYLSGEAPSKGNMKWYVRTDYYVTRVAASDGMNKATDVKTSNIHLTRDMSYSFYGTSSTARTEVVNALSADVTVQETISGGGVTQSRTTWYDRWYWADTGHGTLTQSRSGDIQRSISIKEDNQKNRYTSEYLNDKRNMILINEYGRIKKSAESVPNNDPSVTYISETYSGWFTKTSRDQVNYAQSFYTSGDNRGTISTIHTKEYSSYYSWEGTNPNRCGLVGNYGESMTSSKGSFTRIHMYSGTITYRGHNYEWHITRDYNLTLNANNSSANINAFVKNLGSTKQITKTSMVFTSSSLRSDNNQQTWVNSQIGAKANWAQYIVTRIDQHWGFRDNENPNFTTTFTFKTKSVSTKKSTWKDGNGVTQSSSYYNYTTWQQWINSAPGNTFTRNEQNFPFLWYSRTNYTCYDYSNSNTVGLKSSDKTVVKTKSSRGYFSVAANFYRHSMTWTYPECNGAHPDGLFTSFAKASQSKTQFFHSVAHLTIPYLGNIGQYKALKIKSTCEFMQNATGFKSLGLYFEQPIIDITEQVIDRTKMATVMQSMLINSTLYKNQYHSNGAYGSNNLPSKAISNSTFGYQNYTLFNPSIDHISQLSTPSVKGRGEGDDSYVYHTFSSHVRINDRIMSKVSTVNGVAKTEAVGNGAYRIPEIYTVSMPSVFADINKSSFKRSELGELYSNYTSGCWPQNFTFGVMRFSSSNIVNSIKASSVTQTASSFYFGKAHYNTPDGILQYYNNYVLSKISWNNVKPLRHDVEVDLYGELHAITFTKTFPNDYFTQTFLYESGHYTNSTEEVVDYSINNITKPLIKDEVVEEKIIPYIPPSTYSDEDAEDVFDDVSEDDFVPGTPDPDAD